MEQCLIYVFNKFQGKSIIVSCTAFEHFGKQFMKSVNIYPDGLIQAAIQLAYFKMHERYGIALFVDYK